MWPMPFRACLDRGRGLPLIAHSLGVRAWLVVALVAACSRGATTSDRPREPDVVFVPTPEPVVEKMMELANVHQGDVVYDLGCGDGRLVIAAAKRGARKTVGIDIDPERIRDARANAEKAGVAEKVTFVQGDLFEFDFSDATVVTLFLLEELNMRLRPQILALAPGTRVVSHAFDMGSWKPDRTERVEGRYVHFWTVPERRGGQGRTGQ